VVACRGPARPLVCRLALRWQAHLLDCLVDAGLRDPQPQRRVKIPDRSSHRLRNNGSWVNSHYDDMPGWRCRWSGLRGSLAWSANARCAS
jgi:predicted alpha-1,6-mannanase (GH76 family)